MQYTFEKQKSQVTVRFVVDKNEFEASVDTAYNKTKSKYRIPGFRAGKAPRKLIENYYGAQVFLDDALEILFEDIYNKFLDSEPSVDPVASPDVSIDKFDDEGLIILATIPVKPEFELPTFQGIKVTQISDDVLAEEVDKEISDMRQRAARYSPETERACQNTDRVDIDYAGYVDGVAFEGGTAQNQNLVLGSGQFIPGFEEQVVGMEIGQERDINVKFPEQYHAESLAGKDAVFKVKLNAITKVELPEVTDEFVQDVSEHNNVDELRESIYQRIHAKKKSAAEDKLENDLFEEYVKNIDIELPEKLIDQQVHRFLHSFEHKLSHSRLKFDDYLAYMGQTREQWEQERRPEAIQLLRFQLVLEKFIEQEKIEITDEQLQEGICKLAEENGKDVEQFKKEGGARLDNQVRDKLYVKAFFDRLKQEATITKA